MAQTDTAQPRTAAKWSRVPGTGGWGRDGRGRSAWHRGWVLAVLAGLLALLLLFHAELPNQVGNLGSLVETFLPWAGLAVPVLLVLAVVRRSATALVVLLVPVLVWANLFGALLTGKGGGGYDFTVVQHNVNATNSDIPGTVATLEAAKPDVIALEELSTDQVGTFRQDLAAAYPYHVIEGTVGLWSKYPLSDSKPVDIQIGWTRALRTTVASPHGDVAVYVAHMPSVRVKFDGGFTANQRDNSAEALGQALAAEKLSKVVLLGDLNGTMNDRSLAPITSQMRSAQGSAGSGFGFSWPAAFPMARIDQIMTRGVTPTDAWTLPQTGSDHLPVAAHIEL
ncbi:endonuclease/exonuclease/phosphatase family protein [Streptacidiphilus carbonis]|uniref:endonuclease/exonuclease/phosphatase family protein n=1 Tax=Streptacidiphilus carbonis TaxID=105422 RepID=UPI0005A68BB7|nr:endonuclease/exonuclease/phosphatase family protein [Streptacidiphilus carbonis]